MKKILRLLTSVLALTVLFSVAVSARGNAQLVEVHENEGTPELFVKGVSGVSDATAIVGNTECNDVTVTDFSEGGVYIDTLILIDNSMSVPQTSLDQIKNIVVQLVGARKDGQERFSVTTYSESIGTISEFTSDYQSIQSFVSNIERNDQDTRLTDAITSIIKSGMLEDTEECAFRRLIIFSDGVDDQGGYSAAERDELLNASNIPIYTVGVFDNSGNNDASLANLFSISRETGAAYFLLSNKSSDKINILVDGDNCYQVKDENEWNIIGNALNEDRNIYRFSVNLEDEVKDGSTKTITLNISSSEGEQSVTADNIRMPHVVIEKEETVTEEPAQEVVSEPEPEPEPEPVPEPEKKPSFFQVYGLIFLIAVLVLSAIILIVVLILILRKAGSKKKENNKIREEKFDFGKNPFEPVDEGSTTVILSEGGSAATDGNTVLIFDQGRNYTITLTDVASPARIFSKPIIDRLIIGTSPSVADIVIDYDRSVSHKHCQIKKMGDKFYLADLESTNGTYLNENRILSEVEIYSGSIITLGRTKFRIEMS